MCAQNRTAGAESSHQVWRMGCGGIRWRCLMPESGDALAQLNELGPSQTTDGLGRVNLQPLQRPLDGAGAAAELIHGGAQHFAYRLVRAQVLLGREQLDDLAGGAGRARPKVSAVHEQSCSLPDGMIAWPARVAAEHCSAARSRATNPFTFFDERRARGQTVGPI